MRYNQVATAVAFGVWALLALVMLLLVNAAAPWEPKAAVVNQAWGWVQSCTSTLPQRWRNPDGSLENVRWRLARSGALDSIGGPGTIGFTLIHQPRQPVETIAVVDGYQDTVWVLAHELLHHVLADTTVFGTWHPFVPFAFPCHLMEFQQGGIGLMAPRPFRPPVRVP